MSSDPAEFFERRSLLSRAGMIAGGLFAAAALSGRQAEAQTRTSLTSLQADLDATRRLVDDLATELVSVQAVLASQAVADDTWNREYTFSGGGSYPYQALLDENGEAITSSNHFFGEVEIVVFQSDTQASVVRQVVMTGTRSVGTTFEWGTPRAYGVMVNTSLALFLEVSGVVKVKMRRLGG